MAASASSTFSPMSGFRGLVRSSSQRSSCFNWCSFSANQASSQTDRRRSVVAVASVHAAAEHAAVLVDPYFRPQIPAAFCGVTKKSDNLRSEKSGVDDEGVDADDERLIRDCIGEIVRNLGENPFFLHLFSIKKSLSSPMRLRREAAATTADSWDTIKCGFEREGCKPDAIVLVQQLRVENGHTGAKNLETIDAATSAVVEEANKTWGMLVQWRGLNCASCYILSTTRVSSSGAACTHFCLAKATCSDESLEEQLRKAWLHER